MKILLAICLILIAVLAVLLISIWRQNKTFCRRLAFKENENSRALLAADLKAFGEGELAEAVNRILGQMSEERSSMEMRERLVADTYTNLSHDIRTPLTSLDGYFQLLQETDSKEEQERYLAIIRERIGTMKMILEDLFTFTKLESRSYRLNMERIELVRIVMDTLLSFCDDWKAAGIAPEIQLCDGRIMVQGNETAIKRIIQNIAKNALVHGEKAIRISLQPTDDGFAELRIANRVPNPEEIDVSRVFERFYTADVTRTKASSGLGLAIARDFAEKMNGTTEASLCGEEFVVTVRLPIEE